MAVSVRSCQVSEQQSKLAQAAFERQQKVVLRASFSADADGVTLAPVEPTHLLQHGLILFPNELGVDALEIRENGKVYGVGVLDLEIRELLAKYVAVAEGEAGIGQLQIPVLIFLYYTVSGDQMVDASTYLLTANYSVSPVSFISEVTFKELVFRERDTNPPPVGNFDTSIYRQRLSALFATVISDLEKRREKAK
jgi:hypothetical protein